MRQKIFVFVLAAVLLVGAMPVKEAKAGEYLTVYDALDALGITYDTEEYSKYLGYAYYMFFDVLYSDGSIDNRLILSNVQPNGV